MLAYACPWCGRVNDYPAELSDKTCKNCSGNFSVDNESTPNEDLNHDSGGGSGPGILGIIIMCGAIYAGTYFYTKHSVHEGIEDLIFRQSGVMALALRPETVERFNIHSVALPFDAVFSTEFSGAAVIQLNGSENIVAKVPYSVTGNVVVDNAMIEIDADHLLEVMAGMMLRHTMNGGR